MTMRLQTLVIFLLSISLFGCSSDSGQNSAFDAAKAVAAQKRQPVVVEFTTSNENCDDCTGARRLFETDSSLTALKHTVSFCRIYVDSSEGKKLAEVYDIGIRLPAYLMTDSNGDEIYRFSSFLAPQAFLRSLSRGQADLTTIKARMKRLKSFPNLDDALFLGHHFMGMEEPVQAMTYYRQADKLNTRPDRNFKFEVFSAAANAAWKGDLSFEEMEIEANAVLDAEYRSVINAARVTSNIVSVALQTGDTDRLEKYLESAMDKLIVMQNESSIRIREGFKADRELFVRFDTARAISTKRNSYGPAFRRTADHEFDFAGWCVDRKINLDEAGRILTNLFEAGTLQGMNRAHEAYQLARLERAKGNTEKAIELSEQALTYDPVNPLFAYFLQACREES